MDHLDAKNLAQEKEIPLKMKASKKNIKITQHNLQMQEVMDIIYADSNCESAYFQMFDINNINN